MVGSRPKYVPSVARILVIHTLQLLEFSITILCTHFHHQTSLPYRIIMMTRGMGGEGIRDGTGTVGGGGSGSSTSSCKTSAQNW